MVLNQSFLELVRKIALLMKVDMGFNRGWRFQSGARRSEFVHCSLMATFENHCVCVCLSFSGYQGPYYTCAPGVQRVFAPALCLLRGRRCLCSLFCNTDSAGAHSVPLLSEGIPSFGCGRANGGIQMRKSLCLCARTILPMWVELANLPFLEGALKVCHKKVPHFHFTF